MDRLKRVTRAVFLAVQRVLVPACLFLAYFLAMGGMAVLDRIFRFQPRRAAAGKSFWTETGAAAAAAGEAEEQS